MNELSAGKFVEKKSRFYAHLYTIDTIDDVDAILKKHRSLYKKANHHCYACILKESHSCYEKHQDDGEVGHPGKVLFELLKSNRLNHHVIMVSRIFGGIKLGVGGVSKAFKEAGSATIKHYINKK